MSKEGVDPHDASLSVIPSNEGVDPYDASLSVIPSNEGVGFYPYDASLCVIPSNGGESQYEAFQSVLAHIMSSREVLPTDKSMYSPYELACEKYKIILKSVKKKKTNISEKWFNKNTTKISTYPKRLIYFTSSNKDLSTHYIGLEQNENDKLIKHDPYQSVQAIDTEGFCQMFAFFLLIDPIGFVDVDQSKQINVEEFNKLCYNTQLCFTKFYRLLKDNKDDILAKFKKEFDEINFEYYGIKPGTTCETYLTDFQKLNDKITAVKYYIYDQPLNGWEQLVKKVELWDSFVLPKEASNVGGKSKKSKTIKKSKGCKSKKNKKNQKIKIV